MADTLEALQEQWKKYQDELNKGILSQDAFNTKFDALQKSAEKLGKSDGVKNFVNQLKEGKQKAIDLATSLKDIDSSSVFKKMSSDIDVAGGSLDTLKDKLTNLAISTIALNRLPTPKLFEAFSSGTGAISNMTESFDAFNKLIGAQDNELTRRIRQLTDASDKVNKFEDSLYSAAAASGQLNQYIEETNMASGELSERMSGSEAKMREFSKINLQIAQANGLNLSTVSALSAVLAKDLPNAFDMSSNAGQKNELITGESGKQYQKLDAAIKVARGTGQGMDTVIKYMVDSKRKLNTEAQQSIQNFAKMSEVTQNLRLPFDIMSGYVNSTADQFMYFTDNTNALIDVMGRLGPAFRAANLSPEAIQKLTASMVSNINQMSLAQRSFLSMQTGGPGGLRGGYEIEMLKMAGKFDEIQKKTEQALRKQFGGRVVTLEEAARDEGAARQLAKQVQLVTSGPTKVVGTEAEAYKLFEAMRKGMSSDVVKGTDSLNKALDIGSKRADMQTNKLTEISNTLEDISMSTSIMARNSAKDLNALLEKLLTGQYSKKSMDLLKEKTGVDLQSMLPGILKGEGEIDYSQEASNLSFFKKGVKGIEIPEMSPAEAMKNKMKEAEVSRDINELNQTLTKEVPLPSSVKGPPLSLTTQTPDKTYNVNITLKNENQDTMAKIALNIVKDQLNVRQMDDTRATVTGASGSRPA